jgi:hypothetical protein
MLREHFRRINANEILHHYLRREKTEWTKNEGRQGLVGEGDNSEQNHTPYCWTALETLAVLCSSLSFWGKPTRRIWEHFVGFIAVQGTTAATQTLLRQNYKVCVSIWITVKAMVMTMEQTCLAWIQVWKRLHQPTVQQLSLQPVAVTMADKRQWELPLYHEHDDFKTVWKVLPSLALGYKQPCQRKEAFSLRQSSNRQWSSFASAIKVTR